jgi:hypothetical protein
MSIEKLHNDIEYVSTIVREAESVGMKLEVSTDFEHLQRVVQNNDDKTPLYPMFDTSASFISPANGFWVKGTDATGEVVHVQCLRLLDLDESNLAQHLSAHRYKYVVQGDFTVPDEKLFAISPAASRITGRVVYHGQIWLKGGEDGYRGQGISALLPRYALAMSLLNYRLSKLTMPGAGFLQVMVFLKMTGRRNGMVLSLLSSMVIMSWA